MTLPYDPNLKSSIVAYAKKLKDKSLRDACSEEILSHGYAGKGNFGQLLEKFYFLYEPNSDSEPDFPIAKLELKTTPLKTLKKNEYRSKERLVLNIINYKEIISQEFHSSSFWKKNSSLLLIFYLHRVEADLLDYIIKIVDEWSFPAIDLEVIKKDWETIKEKVSLGKAHELSEGDTFYLGACTKGGKGGNLREQPKNPILAKQRAFSLKQGYVNHVIARLADKSDGTYGKLLTNLEEAKKLSIEEIVADKFKNLIGKNIPEIIRILSLRTVTPIAKNYYAILAKEIINKVFNVPTGEKIEDFIEEFNKADIKVKTVRLKSNGLPEQDVSFPTFKYIELVNETWEEAEIKSHLEQKFLFVFFQYEGDELIFRKIKFWNMPYEDLLKVRDVWQKTIDVILSGNIVAGIYTDKSGKVKRKTNFPSKKFSTVSHVRPHTNDATHTYPLPVIDKFTNSNEYTKHCFWLNSSYVRDEIYLKD